MSSDSDNCNTDDDFQFETNTSTDDSEYNQTRPSLFTQITTNSSTIRKRIDSSLKTQQFSMFFFRI